VPAFARNGSVDVSRQNNDRPHRPHKKSVVDG
jgi:hypothetical protein